MKELKITKREAGQRFDKFLKKYLGEAPPSFIYKMLRKKNIKLNGARADGREILSEGDCAELYLSDETIAHFRAGEHGSARSDQHVTDLRVLYEDDDIVAVDKPAGLLVQGSADASPSVAGLLPGTLIARGSLKEEDLRAFTPAPMHRLDRNTSGIVLCGKSMAGARFLADCMKERRIRKTYLAIASGRIPAPGIYRAFGKKDSASNRIVVSDKEMPGFFDMVTGIDILSRSHETALLDIDLITGRPHQIRAHLAHLCCPVTGDLKYGKATPDQRSRNKDAGRQLLHAYSVTFPETVEPCPQLSGLTVRSPLPEDMRRYADRAGLLSEEMRQILI